MRGRGHSLAGLPVRRLHRGGQQVVHEVAAVDIAILVVLDLLIKRRSQAHGQPAVDLAFHNHRVDAHAAVVHRHEAADLDLAGAPVDVDGADV